MAHEVQDADAVPADRRLRGPAARADARRQAGISCGGAPLPVRASAGRDGQDRRRRFESLEADGLTYVHPDSGRGVRGIDLRLLRGGFTVVTGRIRVRDHAAPNADGIAQVRDQVERSVRRRMSSDVLRLHSQVRGCQRGAASLGLPELSISTAQYRRDGADLEDGQTVVGPRGVRLSGARCSGRPPAHVRQGPPGRRRCLQCAGRRDRAKALEARLRAGQCDQPGGITSPSRLPTRGPHCSQRRHDRRGGSLDDVLRASEETRWLSETVAAGLEASGGAVRNGGEERKNLLSLDGRGQGQFEVTAKPW